RHITETGQNADHEGSLQHHVHPPTHRGSASSTHRSDTTRTCVYVAPLAEGAARNALVHPDGPGVRPGRPRRRPASWGQSDSTLSASSSPLCSQSLSESRTLFSCACTSGWALIASVAIRVFSPYPPAAREARCKASATSAGR